MKQLYLGKHFAASSLDIIGQADAVLDEYAEQGFILTLRQLYYQFVARGWLPNTQRSYKRLGSIINDARLAGLIDWEHMEDRTRNLCELPAWLDPATLVAACANQFRIDKWVDQDYRPEVWIEKDALVGVIADVCDELQVPYFSCRGYTSQSEVHAAGERLAEHLDGGQTPIVFHLGDHDPSGVDMTRDITERLAMFCDEPIEVKRLALNMNQVRHYNPPPNPAKLTDSRCVGYIRRHGTESWELDALEPGVIGDLITRNVLAIRDEAKWAANVAEEEEGRKALAKASDNWPQIQAWLHEE